MTRRKAKVCFSIRPAAVNVGGWAEFKNCYSVLHFTSQNFINVPDKIKQIEGL
jgi:hypothetical protein